MRAYNTALGHEAKTLLGMLQGDRKMRDMYGNEVQCDTPTTRLLAERKRKKNVVESDGAFKFSTRISQPMRAKLAADYLRNAAREIELHQVPVIFEFNCQEVEKK